MRLPIGIWIFLIFSFFFPKNIKAQDETVETIKSRSSVNPYNLGLGVSAGTDIGGAVPVPLSNVPGIVRAYPDVNLSIGAKLIIPIAEHWMLGTEIMYKKISLEAKTRVNNQKFHDKENDMLQYFTGTAKMEMSFTLLEVPLLVKYNFGSSSHRLIVGPYFSYVLNSKFITYAEIGFTGAEPDQVDGIVNGCLEMDFSPYLDNWNMGMIIGYEYEILERLQIGLRLTMGFRDIFESDNRYFDYRMLPMRGSLLLSYDLFRW